MPFASHGWAGRCGCLILIVGGEVGAGEGEQGAGKSLSKASKGSPCSASGKGEGL